MTNPTVFYLKCGTLRKCWVPVKWLGEWIPNRKCSLSIKQICLTEAIYRLWNHIAWVWIPTAASTYAHLCIGYIPDINAALGGCDYPPRGHSHSQQWALDSFRCLEQHRVQGSTPSTPRATCESGIWWIPTTSALQSLREAAHYFKANLRSTVRP